MFHGIEGHVKTAFDQARHLQSAAPAAAAAEPQTPYIPPEQPATPPSGPSKAIACLLPRLAFVMPHTLDATSSNPVLTFPATLMEFAVKLQK